MKIPEIKRFIDLYVPVTTCTLHCHYCYIYHQGLFKNKLPEFKYSPDVVKKALTQERLGGICLINFCGGGETLLPPQVTDYIRVLLENGHFVMVVTNGTVTKRFHEIADFPPELLERLFFKFSYHYLELKKRGLFDVFFGNIRKMRDAGCSFTLELTPNDESIPHIEEIRQLAIQETGAPCHLTIARNDMSPLEDKPILTKLPEEQFYRTWDVFHSDMFTFKRSIFGQKRKEFCYAGDWSFYLNLGTGLMNQCYCSFKTQQIFENPDDPIKFIPIGRQCSMPHCYNGHSFLTLGNIPELDTITYAQIRNRTGADGTEWLKPLMKQFMSEKLENSNKKYSVFQKLLHSLRYGKRKKLSGKIKKLIRNK